MLLAIFLAWLQAAASAPAAPQAPPQPVIKITTRQVEISVVARDKKGQPVADLTRDDFTLLDGGQPQEIRYFHFEKEEPHAEMAALPAGVVSNRVLAAGDGRSVALPNALTVILLDGLNSRFADRSLARDGLRKFLSTLTNNDRVAIYTLTTELRVLHDFAADLAPLQEALAPHKRKDVPPSAEAAAQGAAIDRFLSESMSPTIVNFPQLRTPTTMQALRAIAAQLAGIPGRKTLVWLSDGFPLVVGRRANGMPGRNFETFGDEEQRAIRTLDNAGVVIYPVDARGMIGSFDWQPSTDPSRTPPRSRRAAARMDNQAQTEIVESQGGLREIADGTGGTAFTNDNDLGSAIRHAVEDSAVSYTIAYSPSHNDWNGEFRDLKLTVKRPGVEVHYRKGYYATPDKADDATSRQAALVAAAGSPLPSTALGIFAQIKPAATPAIVQMRINPAGLNLSRDSAGIWIGMIDVALLSRDASGRACSQASAHTYKLTLTQAQYDEARQNGVPLEAGVPACTTAARARVVVRDVATGATGSLDVPLGAPSGK